MGTYLIARDSLIAARGIKLIQIWIPTNREMNTQSIKKSEPEDEIPDIEAKKEIMKGLNAKKSMCLERHSSAARLKLDLFGAQHQASLISINPSVGMKRCKV